MDRLLCEDRVHVSFSNSSTMDPSKRLAQGKALCGRQSLRWHQFRLGTRPTAQPRHDATLRLADAAGTVLGTPYTRTAKPTIASTASAHRRNPSLWGQGEPVFTCDSGVARWHRPVAPAPWFKCSRLDCQLFLVPDPSPLFRVVLFRVVDQLRLALHVSPQPVKSRKDKETAHSFSSPPCWR